MAIDLEFRFGGKKVLPDVRRLGDMRDVVFDKKWLETAGDSELYYMYRDLALSKMDELKIKQHNLRYDITVIPPLKLGIEYIKTAGHYHPVIPGGAMTYPEIYEVLEGKAHYLLQKFKGDAGDIADVLLIEAEQGDKVIIPPDYGHVTINPSKKVLKMSNWVSRNFSSIYESYRKLGGGAYFELAGGEFIKNSNYRNLPEIRFLKPSNFSEFGLRKNLEMYGLVRTIEKLGFLNNPGKYKALFERVLKA